MARNISTKLRQAFDRPETEEIPLMFLTITHPNLGEPICVVNDPTTFDGELVEYQWNGLIYRGYPFELAWITDSEEAPQSKLEFGNADARIGEIIQKISSPPRLRIDVIIASDFDLDINPRVPLGPIIPEVSAYALYLANVSADSMNVSADIISWDYTQEMWPGLRATQEIAPGLYR